MRPHQPNRPALGPSGARSHLLARSFETISNLVVAMGRPKGSRNKRGHIAGGARRGEKWEAQQRERASASSSNFFTPIQPKAKTMRPAQGKEVYDSNVEALIPELGEKFNHASMPWFPVNGIANVASSADDTDEEDIADEPNT